jgi:membrane-bound metal-dependent hydrolase YbcI (DUF457 family)
LALNLLKRVFGDKEQLRRIIVIAIFYSYLSFAYSFIGFLHMQPSDHYHEYSLSKLAIEVFGHFAFGGAAAIPLLDLDLILLTGSLAILIDADHILGAWDFNVSGRPDHSFLYAIVSTIVLVFLAKKLGTRPEKVAKIAFIGTVTLFAHIAYDLFAGSGSSFQLLIPFSFQSFTLQYIDWVPFEGLALVIAGLGYVVSRRIIYPKKRVKILNQRKLEETRAPSHPQKNPGGTLPNKQNFNKRSSYRSLS